MTHLLSATAWFVLLATGLPLLSQVPAWAGSASDPAPAADAPVFDTHALRGKISLEAMLAETAGVEVEAPPPPLTFQALAPQEAFAANMKMQVAALPNPAARPFVLSADSADDEHRALECLAAAVYHEAASEGPAGMAAVAQVVLNRTRHPTYPKSVCGVVYQGAERKTGCQFTFTCDGSLDRPRSPVAWRRAEDIARSALGGQVMAQVGNATHYHTVWVAPYWSPSLTKVATIGQHIFYRWQGKAGLPGAFKGQYAGAELSPGAAAARVAQVEPLMLAVAAEAVEPLSAIPVSLGAVETPAVISSPAAAAEPRMETPPPAAQVSSRPTEAPVAKAGRPTAPSDWFGGSRKSGTRVATPSGW